MQLEQLFVSPWYWVIGGMVLVGLEIIVPGVYLLWLGLGAMVVGVVMLLLPDLSLAWQMLLFALAMLGCIGVGMSLQRRARGQGHTLALNQELQGLVGRSFEAINDFQAGRGRIRVGDGSYTASAHEKVSSGDLVEVIDSDGGCLQVRRVQADLSQE